MENHPWLRQFKKHSKLLETEIRNVDGMQGQELYLIIANLTYVSDTFSLDITREFHRLDVMMSRAKMSLV